MNLEYTNKRKHRRQQFGVISTEHIIISVVTRGNTGCQQQT